MAAPSPRVAALYSTISLPSWSGRSQQGSSSIAATLGNGGWATLLNSAKGPLLINGQPPVPPPDIPQERLTLPSIPVQVPTQQPSAPAQQTPTAPPGNQHLPNQQPVETPTRAPSSPAPQAPASQAPAPQAPPDGGAQAPGPRPGAPPPAEPPPS